MNKRVLPVNRRIQTAEEPSDPGMTAKKARSKKRKKARGRWTAFSSRIASSLQGLRTAASIVFVVVASIALAWGIRQHVVTSPRFAVKTIRIDGTVKRTPEQVTQAAGLDLGMNIFSVDLIAARRRLLQDPWIASAEVERRLPGTLTIQVTEREVAAVVSVDADLYLCTHEGEIFKKLEKDDPIGLVVISGLTGAQVASDRKMAVGRVRSALELLEQYELHGPSKQLPAQEINLGENGSARIIVGKDAVTLEVGRPPYRTKVLRAARVFREVQRQKGDPSIMFLDNEAHPERVVVRMR
jgi:cell division protein FtsQ